MLDGFDTAFLVILQFVFGLLSLLASGVLILHREVQSGRSTGVGARKVASGLSRWVAPTPQRRYAFVPISPQAEAQDPSPGTLRRGRSPAEAVSARGLTRLGAGC